MLILFSKVCKHLVKLVSDLRDAISVNFILSTSVILPSESFTKDFPNLTDIYIYTLLDYSSSFRVSLAELANFEALLTDINSTIEMEDAVYEGFDQSRQLLWLDLIILV